MTADGIIAIAAVLAVLVVAVIYDRVAAGDRVRDWLERIADDE